MPRELSDVLHYFIPDRGDEQSPESAGLDAPPSSREIRGLTPLAVPVRERDAIPVSFVWNLAIEIARTSRRAILLAPEDSGLQPVREWLPTPTTMDQSIGPEFVFSAADDLGALARDARELGRTPHPRGPALAVALLPIRWIRPDPDGAHLLRHPVLFATPETTSLNATQALLERIFEAAPDAEPGVTIHGVDSIDEAERAFDRLALRCETGLGRPLQSYGLLLDDLQVYRAVSDRLPMATAHPHSLASRALADVARLLIADHGDPARGDSAAVPT